MKDAPGQLLLIRGTERIFCRRCGRRLIGKRSRARGLGPGCAAIVHRDYRSTVAELGQETVDRVLALAPLVSASGESKC